MRASWLAAGLCGLAGAASAADRPIELAPLSISTTALPATAAAVSTLGLETQPGEAGLGLTTSLHHVPGVVAQNQYNYAQGQRLAIRGFGARANFGVRGIQLRVDGVPLTLPDGQTEFDALDSELVEQIDVVRGPSATLFGNAAGGAVLVTTRQPPRHPSARITALGGAGDLRRVHLEVGGPLGSAPALASVSRLQLDGFREHAEVRNDQLTGKLAIGAFLIQANALDIESDDPGALNAAQLAADRDQAAPRNLQFNAGEQIRQQRLGVTWQRAADDGSAWDVTAFAGRRDFDNRLPFTAGGQVDFQRRFSGLGLRHTREMGAHTLAIGADLQLQRDTRRRFDNNDGQRGAQALNQDESADSHGVFINDRISLAPGWTASAGLRHDRIRLAVNDNFIGDGDDSGRRRLEQTSFSADISRELGDAALLYTRVASAYESPTLTELANPNGGGFNRDLEPARALNYELGLDAAFGAVTLSAAVYSIRLRDELIPFELANQPGRSFFRNAGRSRRDGLELEAEWAFAEAWQLNGSYSRNRYRFTDYVVDGNSRNGNVQPGIPLQQLHLELSWQQSQYFARLNLRAVDKQFADDGNNVRLPGYAVVNLRMGLTHRLASWQLSPWLGLNNLLDTDYNDNLRLNAFGGRHFEPAPGANVYAGLTAKW